MLRFLRESVKEFDHVVWPTRRETVRYFSITVSTIVVFAVFLFIVGTTFSTSLFAVKDMVSPVSSAPASTQQNAPEIDLQSLLGSGATASGVEVTVSATGSAK